MNIKTKNKRGPGAEATVQAPSYSLTVASRPGAGGGGGTTRFKCHVINSRIMRANKAKECNYGGWAGFCST